MLVVSMHLALQCVCVCGGGGGLIVSVRSFLYQAELSLADGLEDLMIRVCGEATRKSLQLGITRGILGDVLTAALERVAEVSLPTCKSLSRC
jgi:hypothetical protein